jgi:hypothetical protein
MAETVVDPARCPLCGAPNRCALAAGAGTAARCWCADTAIPADRLALVPEPARGVACICAACAAPREDS